MSDEIKAYKSENTASYCINVTAILIWSATLIRIQRTEEKLAVISSICLLMILYNLALIGSCQLAYTWIGRTHTG